MKAVSEMAQVSEMGYLADQKKEEHRKQIEDIRANFARESEQRDWRLRDAQKHADDLRSASISLNGEIENGRKELKALQDEQAQKEQARPPAQQLSPAAAPGPAFTPPSGSQEAKKEAGAAAAGEGEGSSSAPPPAHQRAAAAEDDEAYFDEAPPAAPQNGALGIG